MLNKFHRYLLKYLLWSIPLVVLLVAMGDQGEDRYQWLQVFWDVLAWNFLVWFAGICYLLAKLVASRAFREEILKRWAGIKERDERELIITGEASKSALLSTLAIALVLFFLAGIQFNVVRNPVLPIGEDKHGSISIGFRFNGVDKVEEVQQTNGSIVSMHHLPLSKEAILLGLIVWQLASFHYFARRSSLS